MAKAHEEMKRLLAEDPGNAFALGLTRQVYEWADRIPDDAIRYRVFEELTVRYETGGKTKRGLEKQDHYRFDAVLFIQPGYSALNQRQCFTVGIELKGSKADLVADKKMRHYLGWTDLFFIGVPAELTEDAIRKAEEVSLEVFGDDPDYAKAMVGVFDIENGFIYKMPPRKQRVSLENQLRIQEQVIYNVMFDDIKTVNVKFKDISIENAPVSGLQTRNPSETSETASGGLKPPQANGSTPEGKSGHRETGSDVSGPTSPESPAAGNPAAGRAGVDRPAIDNPTVDRTTLDEDFVAARNGKRAENRARREELARDLTERNRLLTNRTREQLAGLSDRDQLVFWAIRDATAHGGINGIDIPSAIGQSPAAVNRSMKKLKDRGLVTLDGAPKYGKFKAIGDALKSSRCVTCRLNEECAGTAMHCGSYQAVANK